MSLIEHVWDLVGRRLARDPCPATSKDELLLYKQAGLVDKKDTIYTAIKLRAPSTVQSSKRPSHHTTRMYRVNCLIGRYLDSSSTFTAGPVSSQNITRCMVEQHLVSRRPLRVLPMTPTHRHFRFEWCCARWNRTATEWNHVVLSYELSFHGNRICVWRPLGEVQWHTFPTAGVMVWGVIAYDTRSPLILIHGKMPAQWYVHDILLPNVLPLMAGLTGAIS
ncbi:uncharacterized protein TNCV_897281 [Trichonephila clavipes]|nr:uncharacterized protein TNCV_897281 [Trichonephila clavipes]